MRRVRGGPVRGKSEKGHGWGQTITRSIEDDIQTEEYRGYRDYLYYVVLEMGTWKEWSGCSRNGKDRMCNDMRGYDKELDGYRVDRGKE